MPEPQLFAGLHALHKIARLCNGAKFDSATASRPIEDRVVKGDPTDTALLRFSEVLSVPPLGIDTPSMLSRFRRLFEIPFNSRNKWMLTVVQDNETLKSDISDKNAGIWMFVKGAPDMLFDSCSSVMKANGTVVPLDDFARQHISALQSEWSSEGQRVLAL
jgi:sodium/potassium-transporting ATPase subunit alpha